MLADPAMVCDCETVIETRVPQGGRDLIVRTVEGVGCRIPVEERGPFERPGARNLLWTATQAE